MTLKFLQETSQSILGKLKSDLSYIDPTVDFDSFDAMTLRGISRELSSVRESLKKRKQGTYGSWLREEGYVRDTLVEEALQTIYEEKSGSMRKERLIPGSTYYSGVARYGAVLEGKYTTYLGEQFTGWVEFRETAAVAKAMTVLRHGTNEDFRQIYVGIADGCVDALNEVSLAHIVESSTDSLKLIEAYCDSRWTGPWPWEIEAPEKMKHMIESREENKMIRITEMQNQFVKVLREFEEGNLNQYEMVGAAQEMMSKVDSIISDLGKLSATGIEVTAQAKASGDDSLVEPMQAALGEPLNTAIGALTDLKASLASATSQLTGSGAPMDDMGGDPAMGGEMGSPADAMGADPMAGGDPDVDALADVDIGGDDEERPMKEV